MKNHFFSSDIFHNIIRVFVILIGMFYMCNGCKNYMTPEAIVNAWAGNWELSWTTISSDSIFVHKAWIILNKDSTFSCNASFFLRSDSLKAHPINGFWAVYMPDKTRIIENYAKKDRIGFSSDSLSSAWDIYGGVSEGYMNWVNDYGQYYKQYNWRLVK
jgi:hypothetical protein